MNTLERILKHNEQFVQQKAFQKLNTEKNNPAEKIVIVSCMDTRLIQLLPQAMNIHNGDAKLIKVAGAVINDPFDAVMKSIIVAVHALAGKEVFIIGHDDCGMASINSNDLKAEMLKNDIDEKTFTTLENLGINLNKWIAGFGSVENSVTNSVNIVRKHPLIPKHIPISGLVINPETGVLRTIIDGYNQKD